MRKFPHSCRVIGRVFSKLDGPTRHHRQSQSMDGCCSLILICATSLKTRRPQWLTLAINLSESGMAVYWTLVQHAPTAWTSRHQFNNMQDLSIDGSSRSSLRAGRRQLPRIKQDQRCCAGRPSFSASLTSSANEFTSIFSITRERWTFMVFSTVPSS